MLDTTRWWYKRGVAGFRLDAVDTLFEDPELHNNPVLPGNNAQGDPNMENKYNTNLPEVHDELQKLRKVADEFRRRAHRRNLDRPTPRNSTAITARMAMNFRCPWISCS